ncbi:MAG TPA: FtsQ-type POTRA domain-containing protein [Polyangiaceae bacterium]|nr:FtsQ-type POTRA domain-containing protein [Polyangiaceae bacterium]
MSNRRNQKARRKGPTRAPAEDGSPWEGDDAALPRRSGELWKAGLKILAGLVLTVATAAALGFGVHRYATTTPRFAIREVVVDGIRRLTRDQVLEGSGVRSGENVFLLDSDQAEAAILKNPWIETARVTRRLPGNVRVEIRERAARALWILGDQSWLVSADGVPFKRLEPQDPHDLPVLTGLSEAALGRDSRAELARLGEALALLEDYERLPLGRAFPPEELHLDERGHAVLTVGRQGVALHLGAPPYQQKLARAVRVLGKVEAGAAEPGVVFLDNEAHPERVVVRVK